MTSLRLQSHGAFAMLICDNELWRVSTNADGVPNDCFLSRVWITEQSNVSVKNALVQACIVANSTVACVFPYRYSRLWNDQ